MTRLYLDVLDKPRQAVFKQLRKLAVYGGVLAGGTAIALQLRHRRSEDFDVFFPVLITDKLKKLLFSITDKPIKTRLDNPRQLTVVNGQGIKITLVIHEFPSLRRIVETSSLPLFNLADLASNKAFTIGKRGVWRDYVDLFFLLKSKSVSLGQIIKEAEKRFGDQFAAKLFLEQLVYREDVVDFKIDYIGKNYTPKEVMLFLEKAVKQYLEEEILSV